MHLKLLIQVFSSKCTKCHLAAGLHEELQRSPRPPSIIEESLFLREGYWKGVEGGKGRG